MANDEETAFIREAGTPPPRAWDQPGNPVAPRERSKFGDVEKQLAKWAPEIQANVDALTINVEELRRNSQKGGGIMDLAA